METRVLRTEVYGKLAKHIATLSGTNSSQFKFILSDLGLGETVLKITEGDNGPNISLMATMSNTRGKEWIKQLKQVAKLAGAT